MSKKCVTTGINNTTNAQGLQRCHSETIEGTYPGAQTPALLFRICEIEQGN